AHSCRTNCLVKVPADSDQAHSPARRSAIPDGEDVRRSENEALSPGDNPVLSLDDEESSQEMTTTPVPLIIHELDSASQYDYANVSEYPYFVTVDVRYGNRMVDQDCPDRMQRKRYSKGLIISRKYVLWVGFLCPWSCTYIVIVGSDEFGEGGNSHKAKAIQDKDWKEQLAVVTKEKSVLLLRLYKPITFGVGVQPVELSDINEYLSSVRSGILVYEDYSDSKLLKANRTALSSRDCEEVIFYSRIISESSDVDQALLPGEIFCLIGSYDQFNSDIDGMFFVDGRLSGILYKSIDWPSTAGGSGSYFLMHDISYYGHSIKHNTGV
ncbi:hypothetical protein QAD02_023852, partial [Eretmocerus hayati]